MRERSIRILPGQSYDAETGMIYNYMRDYDPTIGRYLQSDPLVSKADSIRTRTFAIVSRVAEH